MSIILNHSDYRGITSLATAARPLRGIIGMLDTKSRAKIALAQELYEIFRHFIQDTSSVNCEDLADVFGKYDINLVIKEVYALYDKLFLHLDCEQSEYLFCCLVRKSIQMTQINSKELRINCDTQSEQLPLLILQALYTNPLLRINLKHKIEYSELDFHNYPTFMGHNNAVIIGNAASCNMFDKINLNHMQLDRDCIKYILVECIESHRLKELDISNSCFLKETRNIENLVLSICRQRELGYGEIKPAGQLFLIKGKKDIGYIQSYDLWELENIQTAIRTCKEHNIPLSCIGITEEEAVEIEAVDESVGLIY